MPLTRPALVLGTGARGVPDARRWITRLFGELGRSDLIETTELAVTELVTNALLHGQPPIEVRVRGTSEHPRVEVWDHSTQPPEIPSPADASTDASTGADPADDDLDLLLTFGRGLSLVARASEAWGADVEADRKVVWFVPATDLDEHEGAAGTVTGLPRTPPPDPVDPVDVELRAMPHDAYLAFRRHYDEIRREVRLLALANAEDYPIAGRLARLFDDLDGPLRSGVDPRQVTRRRTSGGATVDQELVLDRAQLAGVEQLTALLDVADDFCRSQRMLSVARSPEQVRFQHWLLGEVISQGAGREPRAYPSDAATSASLDHSSAS